MGERAPRAPSIVGWFCRLPWLVSVAGSVAAEDCPLAHEAAQAPLAARHADAQSVSPRATIPDGRAAVGSAEPLPRCDELGRLFHVG